uniref:Secreted protein n=1 Tax=Heterorhabditis bacteriophora TaxID=37862 RepID=A0A1I7WCQ7_HETBA
MVCLFLLILFFFLSFYQYNLSLPTFMALNLPLVSIAFHIRYNCLNCFNHLFYSLIHWKSLFFYSRLKMSLNCGDRLILSTHLLLEEPTRLRRRNKCFSDVDERDHPFIDRAAGRTVEGFYR